jgi:hypothetical protein
LRSNISEFTPAQLANAGALTPSLTIEYGTPPFSGVSDFTFDAAGNMWVADYSIIGSGVLDMFNAADLNATGDITPTPAVTLSPAAIGSGNYSIEYPTALAIDDRGDLWLSNARSTTYGDIVEFTAEEIGASGSPLPKVVLQSNKHGTNLLAPNSLLFGPLAP